jgi:predicted CXXCH cytochrome family protein
VCHGPIAAQMQATGGHGKVGSNCQGCHLDSQPGDFGPGHRSVPTCASCHTEEQTHHDPEAGTAGECTQCHTPHGSLNLRLVNEIISTPENGNRPVEFTNRDGKADGSFASVSKPGTGVCEICHTSTDFYRADGTSEEKHFETTCTVCHTHDRGFSPP